MQNAGAGASFNLRHILIFVAALLIVLAGGLLDMTADRLAGEDISFNLFFLIPVGLVVWFIGIWPGIFISAFSAFVCYMADISFMIYDHESMILPLWNSISGFIFFICLALLLHALRRELLTHKQLAMEDFLTKATNSRAFYNYAKIEIARIKRYDKPLTIVYMDIDNFKHINDTYGHTVGDGLLVAFVNAVRRNIRATDAVSRLGGDEFALLLPEMAASSAEPFMTHLRAAVDGEMKDKGFNITYSTGVLTCTKSPASVIEMIKLVDQAMFEVKRNGKNSVKYIIY
jgi:diguanylate cyclase (GGDEF)-like protein